MKAFVTHDKQPVKEWTVNVEAEGLEREAGWGREAGGWGGGREEKFCERAPSTELRENDDERRTSFK